MDEYLNSLNDFDRKGEIDMGKRSECCENYENHSPSAEKIICPLNFFIKLKI